MQSDHRRGIVWALISAFCIAAFIIPWKLANLEGGASINALILLVAAAVFTTLLTGVQQRAVPSFRRFDVVFAAWLAIFTLAGNFASAEAVQRISPSLMAVMQRSEVFTVALLAWPLIGERVEKRFWLGAIIVGCGLVLLQLPFGSQEERGLGMLLAIASSVCFAVMAVSTRKYIRRIDIVSVNALRLWMSVALWFVFNGLPLELVEVGWRQAWNASLAAFFGPFAGRLCLMMAARHIEARISTLVVLIAPVMTLALAWVVLGDLPTLREIQGSAIMLVGIGIPVVTIGWSRKRQ